MRLYHNWENKSLGMAVAQSRTMSQEKSQAHRLWQRLKRQRRENSGARISKTI